MTQNTNIEKQFKTPLGIVRCGLNCEGYDPLVETKNYQNGKAEIFKTAAHSVEFIEFKISLPLYTGDTVTDSSGWIFRIEKTSDTNEDINTYCLLDTSIDPIDFNLTSGQYLTAIEADNNEWILHIGTEDGEMLYLRAAEDDWFPKRFEHELEFFYKITTSKRNGFVTKIPALNEGERFYIHYLTAYDKKDEKKINTLLAVDAPKRELKNCIGYI